MQNKKLAKLFFYDIIESERVINMIKNLYFKNIRNFAFDLDVDFVSKTRKSEPNVKSSKFEFGKTPYCINDINVVYGKNNVGKTNLLKSISSIIQFIQGKSSFDDLRMCISKEALKSNDSSKIQITFAVDNNEFRYGIEFDKEQILDEKLFVRYDGASRESYIFERKEHKFSTILENANLIKKAKINPQASIIMHLQSFEEPYMEMFEKCFSNFVFVASHDDVSINEELMNMIIEDKKVREEIVEYIKNIDVGISDIKFKKYGEEYIKKFQEVIKNLGNNSGKLSDDMKEIIENGIPHFGFKSNEKETAYSINFIHDNGNEFSYDEISYGTRTFFTILATAILWGKKTNSIILLDEIESGLHIDLLKELMNLINATNRNHSQIIISTHAPRILDLDYISNDSKMFFVEEGDALIIDYASNYALKKEHKVSNRYELDVFGVAPKLL